MTTYIIEIHPKAMEFDPLAHQIKNELLDAGQTPKSAVVKTSRLFRLEADLTPEQIKTAATTLLLDPVVETISIEDNLPSKKKKTAKLKGGFILDVWPKPGVTDPVGETVEKGLKDLGISKPVHASSAQRYLFPKLTDQILVENLAKKTLANEMIHDIHIRKS